MYSEIEIEKYFNFIIEEISNGNSLRKSIINLNAKFNIGLSSQTFYRWIDSDTETSKQYARTYACACEERVETIVDEALDIVDDTSRDKKTVDLGDGVEIEKTDTEAIQRSKLRFEARQWLVGKLNPKKYGNKIDVTTNGESLNVPILNIDPLSDETNNGTSKNI